MELTNDFEVTVPLAEAWKVLTDVERIAPCMPGAQLKEVEGDEYRGVVKVKVGPITASYRGAARFEELDEAAHRAVLRAEGREMRGQGNASATITASLREAADGRTAVSVVTDLNVTGKVAQFGRGVLADVSAKLLGQFVENLETTVLSGGGGGAGPDTTVLPIDGAEAGQSGEPSPVGAADGHETEAHVGPEPESQAGPESTAPESAATKQAAAEPVSEPATTTIRQINHPEPEPVDLVDVAGGSLVRRLLPYASIAGAIFLLRIVIYAMRRRKA